MENYQQEEQQISDTYAANARRPIHNNDTIKNLTELIQQRIAQIEQDLKATAAYQNELVRAPNYARDEMLIGMVSAGMGESKREWTVLKSLLNGGLAAEGGCFPPFGSYLYTDRNGNQSAFSIREFFFKSPGEEYAKVKWLDGREEDLYVHFFIGAKLQPLTNQLEETLLYQENNRLIYAQGDVANAE